MRSCLSRHVCLFLLLSLRARSSRKDARLLVDHGFDRSSRSMCVRNRVRRQTLQGAAAEGFLELEAARLKREEEAAKLVSAGFPLLHLPALANPHTVLVSQTVSLFVGVWCKRCAWSRPIYLFDIFGCRLDCLRVEDRSLVHFRQCFSWSSSASLGPYRKIMVAVFFRRCLVSLPLFSLAIAATLLPSPLALSNSSFFQATSSTLICMPQHRNTANRIFGGFLMHRAYEVAFCAAFMFGGSRPRFSEIDEVRCGGTYSSIAFGSTELGCCVVGAATPNCCGRPTSN